MEIKQQQTSGTGDGEGKSAKDKSSVSPYSKYSLNMMVFFAVLWAVCFMTIFYTAEFRHAVPTWVDDFISIIARSNSNDSYEAQSDIYAERSFSYSIYDRQAGVPLKVDFTEMPDEKQDNNSLPEADVEKEKPAQKETASDDVKADAGQSGALGEAVRIASEGECLIQIKEIAIHEASKEGGEDGDKGAVHCGVANYYEHVNVDDIIVKKGDLLFYKKSEPGENGRETYRRIFTPKFYRLLAYKENHILLSRRHGNWHVLVLNWVLAGMVILALGFCLFSWRSNIFESINELVLCGVCLVIHILCIIMAHAAFKRLGGGPTFFLYALMPMALGPALVSNMIGKRVGLCAAMLLSTLTPLIVDDANHYQLFIIALSYSIIGVLAFNNVRKRKNFVVGGAFIIIVVMLLCIMYVYQNDIRWVWDGFSPFWSTVSIYVSANALLTIVALFLLPFLFEMVFRVTTTITFNELCTGDHKLLERLRDEAPGTYEHCTAVARLASAAAKAIGANSKMAEACALFHDIGKLKEPKKFAENLLLGEANPHEKLSPLESCAVLRHHVEYGLTLARESHLPVVIREAIGQHHGTSVMAGFYAKACAEAEVNGLKMPDSKNYSYINTNPEGEENKAYMGLPMRKEVVLVSIADFCEAAIRSCMSAWDKPSYELIRNKVVELIQERLKEHQFDKARIQICELNVVVHSLVDVFCSKYHLRPQYETTEEQVVKLKTMRASEVNAALAAGIKPADKGANDADVPSEPDKPLDTLNNSTAPTVKLNDEQLHGSNDDVKEASEEKHKPSSTDETPSDAVDKEARK